MQLNDTVKNALIIVTGSLILLVAATFIIPWSRINWGAVSVAPASTVTVTGQADTQISNQVARFNAGITATSDDKQTAVDQANQDMEAIIQAVKDLGISEENIQTESVSVSQDQDFIPETGRSTPGQWRASSNISIKLEDIDRASELTDTLTQTPATNVYGPNFTVEEDQAAQVDLANQAIENARQKAQSIAEASGRQLGQVISVTEGRESQGPIVMEARGLGGGGGTPIEPGSATVTQTVTVTFELR